MMSSTDAVVWGGITCSSATVSEIMMQVLFFFFDGLSALSEAFLFLATASTAFVFFTIEAIGQVIFFGGATTNDEGTVEGIFFRAAGA